MMWWWNIVSFFLISFLIKVSSREESIFDDGPWRLPLYTANTFAAVKTKNFRNVAKPTRYRKVNQTTIGGSGHLKDAIPRYHIPREMWITRKSLPSNFSSLGWNVQRMITQNPRWHVHLVDDALMNQFMEDHFANTSTLWAYQRIHPQVGVSRADLWRYAVLWLYGGLYIDDDAYFREEVDTIIGVNDTLIIASEGNPSVDVCYNQYFHLSPHFFHKHYPYHDILNDTVTMIKHRKKHYTHPLTGKVIVNWAIFVKSQHLVMLETLQNVIEIIKLEYFHWNVLSLNKHLQRWMYCVCGTGPYVFTSTIVESILKYGEDKVSYSYRGKDFVAHGGMSKVSTGSYQGEDYYGKIMRKYPIPLLGNYTDDHYSGKLIQYEKEINYVMNRTRFAFQDWDTFMYLNFSDHGKHVRKVSEEIWNKFPINDHVLTVKDADMLYGEYNEERRVYALSFQRLI